LTPFVVDGFKSDSDYLKLRSLEQQRDKVEELLRQVSLSLIACRAVQNAKYKELVQIHTDFLSPTRSICDRLGGANKIHEV
jgi:hypothetical protein